MGMLAQHSTFAYFDTKYALMRAFLFSLLCSFALTGCSKEPEQEPSKYCTEACSTLAYTPIFENYDPIELGSVTVRHYKPDGTFSMNSLINEHTYTLSDTNLFINSDFQPIGLGFSGLTLSIDQDHEIEVIPTGRVYRIWDIVEGGEVGSYLCEADQLMGYSCATKAKSYSFSGGLHRVEQSGTSPAYLFLVR